MSLNPEFRRNLWLHLSWQRLFAAPTLTVIVVAAFMASPVPEWMNRAAELACFVVLGLWGTRRAADSLSEEVSGGTWEGQRMSGLGAWQMAWGKLLGGTVFVWYCTAFALLVLIAARLKFNVDVDQGKPVALTIYNIVAGGLLSHFVAFAVAIVLLRKAVSYRRLTITLAQTCGFITFVAFAYGGLQIGGPDSPYRVVQGLFEDHTGWFGNEVQVEVYRAISITILGAWAMLAIYRLMRLELQYRNWPWAWMVFVAFMLLFAAGLNPAPSIGPVGWLIGPMLMGFCLTYLSLFADVRDPVRYRWAMRAIGSGDFGQALGSTPWWLISFLATIGITAATIAQLPSVDVLRASGMPFSHVWGDMTAVQIKMTLILMLLFSLRDILVVLWLSFGPKRQRSDVSGLIFLLVAYVPMGAILWGLGGKSFIPLVMPVAASGGALDILPILVELGVIGAMLYTRWQAATHLGKKY